MCIRDRPSPSGAAAATGPYSSEFPAPQDLSEQMPGPPPTGHLNAPPPNPLRPGSGTDFPFVDQDVDMRKHGADREHYNYPNMYSNDTEWGGEYELTGRISQPNIIYNGFN